MCENYCIPEELSDHDIQLLKLTILSIVFL